MLWRQASRVLAVLVMVYWVLITEEHPGIAELLPYLSQPLPNEQESIGDRFSCNAVCRV